MNLQKKSGYAHYFSRSKNRIWKKGERSGNTQKVKEIRIDCDNDAILLLVEQKGVACHTGNRSCFFRKEDLKEEEVRMEVIENYYDVLDILEDIIKAKKGSDPKESYTALLFSKGENSILKKVVEEAGEVCFAIKDKKKEEIIYEAADLIYHLLVALNYSGVSLEEVRKELKGRFGKSGLRK